MSDYGDGESDDTDDDDDDDPMSKYPEYRLKGYCECCEVKYVWGLEFCGNRA